MLFPDVNDRTPNDPAVLLSKAQVENIFSYYCSRQKNPAWQDVQELVTSKAKEAGWDQVRFSGKQAILIAEFAEGTC